MPRLYACSPAETRSQPASRSLASDHESFLSDSGPVSRSELSYLSEWRMRLFIAVRRSVFLCLVCS
jgi:hypothetical protein